MILSKRAAVLATASLLLVAPSHLAWGRSGAKSPPAEVQGPAGHWAGAGLQVDGFGNPLELTRIDVTFDDDGTASISYPSLGCAGRLTRVGAAHGVVQYREDLTTGAEKCPSGALVGFRPAGDRWIYSWSLNADWLQEAPTPSQSLPHQYATGPKVAYVRSGVLSGFPTLSAPQPRDPNATVAERIAHIESSLVPPVLVEGESPKTRSLAQEMAALHVPGASVAVIHNGKIEWAKAYGDAKVGVAPVTVDTLFQAASISKPITAMVVMRVAQERGLDLDRDVNAYLKSWKVPQSAYDADHPVTLRRLLTHTAGFTVHGFSGYSPGAPLPTLKQILDAAPPAHSGRIQLDTVPGTRWNYSGGGYVLIRQVIEDVTGEPFAQVARHTLFDPTGMAHSAYEQPLPADRMAEAATAYESDGRPIAGGANVYPEVTPDGLWTTPSDLARAALAMQASLKDRLDAASSSTWAQRMVEPDGLGSWGLGWGVGGHLDGHPYFWHSGSNAGFKCVMFVYDNGDGAIVMMNSDSGGKLDLELLRAVAYEYGWPNVGPYRAKATKTPAKVLDSLGGRYRLGRYATLTVERQGDQLFIQGTRQPRQRLYPTSGSAWFAIDPDAFTPNPHVEVFFKRGVGGAISGLLLRESGVDVPAARMTAAQASALDASLAAHRSAKAPAPDSERLLRGYLEQLAAGRPDYARLSRGAAAATRGVMLNYGGYLARLGPLERLTFKTVDANGADRFEATFRGGAVDAQIIPAEDGGIEYIALISDAFN